MVFDSGDNMLQTYTVAFFGHRYIDNVFAFEDQLEQLIHDIIETHAYTEFLVGRDGEFDQIVSSTIIRVKRKYRNDNSAHVWVLPYAKADFLNNEEDYRKYYGLFFMICVNTENGIKYRIVIGLVRRKVAYCP